MKRLSLILILAIPLIGLSQTKKVLDHSAYDEWRRVSKELISNDGKLVTYSTKPNGYGNEMVHLHAIDGTTLLPTNAGPILLSPMMSAIWSLK